MQHTAIPEEAGRPETVGFEHDATVVSGARDRRLVHRMLYHWAALGDGAGLPSIDRLDPAAIPASWQDCFLVSVPDRDGGFVFDYLGATFLADHGAGPPTSAVAAPGSLLDHVLRALPLAAAARAPVTTGGAFLRPDRRLIKFRSILLPFAGPASGNVYLLGAAGFRREAPRPGAAVEEVKCYKYEGGVWILERLPAPSPHEPV